MQKTLLCGQKDKQTGRTYLQTNHMSNKEIVSIIHKELPKLNIKIKNPFTKWAKDMYRHLIKEHIQITSKHIIIDQRNAN